MRKLLPESWGFLCPVHTPDGAPCGLLSHLTATCRVVAAPPENPEDVQQAIITVGDCIVHSKDQCFSLRCHMSGFQGIGHGNEHYARQLGSLKSGSMCDQTHINHLQCTY